MSDASIPPPARLPERLLCGPGPSNVSQAVLDRMNQPLAGHLDPGFLQVNDEICDMLRRVFRTSNRLTFPLSGPGSAGMEAGLVNMIEPGDRVVIGVNGVFGARMAEIARRSGAEVTAVEFPWGSPVDPEQFVDAFPDGPVELAAVVHAETSTGCESDVRALGLAVRERSPETIFVVDAVTSLAGIPLEVDAWGVDVCYSGTQKCLSVPPGLSPITFSDRALETIEGRRTPVRSWFLDVTLISGYLDASSRAYHHTAPITSLVGLHEGLRLVLGEGLVPRWERHRATGGMLQAALVERGYELFASEGHRLPQLTTALLPEGVDDAATRARLLAEDGIEIGGGLGTWAGKLWRLGLMGENATAQVVDRLLHALP